MREKEADRSAGREREKKIGRESGEASTKWELIFNRINESSLATPSLYQERTRTAGSKQPTNETPLAPLVETWKPPDRSSFVAPPPCVVPSRSKRDAKWKYRRTMEILMIDWIRKRIIIEKNAECWPKKKKEKTKSESGWIGRSKRDVLKEKGARPTTRRGREKERELLGIIYQYPSKPRIRMRRFRGAISGARGEGVLGPWLGLTARGKGAAEGVAVRKE